MIRVALCDDDRMLASMLAKVIGADPGIEVVAVFSDGVSALNSKVEVDVWLLDVRMDGLSGLDVCRRLVERDASVKIVMMTALPDGRLDDALKAGARGFVFKDEKPTKLRHAVRAVFDGMWVSTQVPERVLLEPPGESIIESARDRQIVDLILTGASTKEMASSLSISEPHLKRQIGILMKRAGVASRPLLMAKLHAEAAARPELDRR